MDQKMDISLIIPVYNESQIIEDNVNELRVYMHDHLSETRWEIILVNDGSTDDTPKIIDNLAEEHQWCRSAHHPRNLGRGKAIRTGFEVSEGDIIVTLDADLSYAPYHISKMVNALEINCADIVLASAYHPEGTVENVPRFRLAISKMGNLILTRFFKGIGNFHTWTCTVRAFRSSKIKSLDLISFDKELHLEILRKAHILGFSIIEVPADLKWRETKKTKDKTKKARKAKFFLGKTSSSHLASSFIYRPGSLFLIPMLILSIVFLYTTTTISIQAVTHIVTDSSSANLIMRTIRAVRYVYDIGTASFYIGGIALISLIQFLFFYLLSRQTYSNYIDIYSALINHSHPHQLPKEDSQRRTTVGKGESINE